MTDPEAPTGPEDQEPAPDKLARLRDAAIAAELATGNREETLAQARTHVLVRLARMAVGFAIVTAGLAMLVLPGPGLLVVAAGFAVLARDFAWADRTLTRIRRRLPQDDDGRISPRTWAVVVVASVAAVTASLAWTLLR